MDGYRRRYPYYGMPQAQGFYDPYRKGPAWGQGLRELLNNIMMMRQMKETREQREFENKLREEQQKLSKTSANLQLQRYAYERRMDELEAKERMRQEKGAREELTPEQYKRWRYRLGAPTEPSVAEKRWQRQQKLISPEREQFINGIVNDINLRIRSYTTDPSYGRGPSGEQIKKRIERLNAAKGFYRDTLAIGTERKLESEEWENVLKASNLERIETEGLYWKKKAKPTAKPKDGPPWDNPETITIQGVGTAYLSPSKKLLWFNGRIISQNPDGTFTINNKKYRF